MLVSASLPSLSSKRKVSYIKYEAYSYTFLVPLQVSTLRWLGDNYHDRKAYNQGLLLHILEWHTFFRLSSNHALSLTQKRNFI